MANKKIPGKSKTRQTTVDQGEGLSPSTVVDESQLSDAGEPPPDEEPPPEVIPVGDDLPIDDKPPLGDEPAQDQESEGYVAEREALRVLHERITELGFDSVFEVVRDGPAEVRAKILSRTPQIMDPMQEDELFDQAQARAAGLTRLYAQLCARSEPALQALAKLEPPESPEDHTWVHRSIGGSGNYEDWFKQTSAAGFAHPDSVGSLFSPASYLTDLYRAAKPLHPSTSGLQLNLRRPDLGPLLLSDANLNEEVSTLALTLEVLEAGVTGDVDELLRTSVYPMNLPYNHASEQILQGMAARKSSPAELWSVLGDFEGQALRHDANLSSWATRMPANYAWDALGMSPELLKICTEPQNTHAPDVMKYFGLTSLNQVEYGSNFKAALQLPLDTILTVLGAGPFYDVSNPGISGIKVNPEQLFTIACTTSVENSSFTNILTNPWISTGGSNQLVLHFGSTRIEGNDGKVGWIAQVGDIPARVTEQVLTEATVPVLAPDRYVTAYLYITLEQYLANPVPIYIKGINVDYPEVVIPLSDALELSMIYVPKIAPPQTYGARYINGWVDGTTNPPKPMYWYIGAGLGQPASKPPNSPSTSGLYNRNGRGFERLNRLVRLQRHVKVLSFEELDWLISQASDIISAHPLTQSLQALAVYLPLRQRYGMTVDSFAACLGSLNTFHGAGKLSFYTTLFGDVNLIGQANVDFQQATQDQSSLNARARLCQGLKIDDATLIVLAQFLPAIGANKVLPVLGLEQISALYRLVAIPRLFGLSVVEALHFWDVLAEPDAIVQALAQPRPNQIALGVLIRTGYLVDWMHSAELNPAQLMALTSRRYPVQSTPELQVFIANIYSTLTGRAVVEAARQATEDAVLRAQLARHIGAEFNLKPNIATAALVWVDAVAAAMAPSLQGYNLMSFWADIERVGLGTVTLDALPQAVQYAYLMRQFAQVCHWAQLGEQDLDVLLPASAAIPSALTGELNPPILTLQLLLLLSRYRKWQRILVAEVAEARKLLQRAAAQDPALTVSVAAQQISDLHGWDLTQTLVLMNASVPRSFAALLPLLQRMKLSQRLGLSPTDLLWVAKLTEPATVSQETLAVIAAKVIAAAHG